MKAGLASFALCLASLCTLPTVAATPAEQVTPVLVCSEAATVQYQLTLQEMASMGLGRSGIDMQKWQEAMRRASVNTREVMVGWLAAIKKVAPVDEAMIARMTNLAIVLNSVPEAARLIAEAEEAKASDGSQARGRSSEVWKSICAAEIARKPDRAEERQQMLCNTFAVIGLMRRLSMGEAGSKFQTPQTMLALLKEDAQAKSLLDGAAATTWVDGNLRDGAVRAAAAVAAAAPLADSARLSAIVQKMAEDPINYPYGAQCRNAAVATAR
jgi:hypothetical protein